MSERWLTGALPFELTGDQLRTIEEIDEDLASPRAMQRLLMGEVGSGKTVVALYAMLRAIEHGHQAALMAPTETLAEQHFATIQRLMGSEQLACALLTGSTPARRRQDTVGQARERRAVADRRHARADRAGYRLWLAGGRGRRRAASLRRAPAGGPARKGGAAHAAHDRHADPPHARPGGLRRPRHEHAARAASRTPADRHPNSRRRARASAGIRGPAGAAATPADRPSWCAR